MSDGSSKLAYVLKGYPRTSETFIAHEIHLLEQAGHRLHIFSIKRLSGQKKHRVFDLISAPVTFLPSVTPSETTRGIRWVLENRKEFAGPVKRLFFHSPSRFLRAALRTFGLGFRYRFSGVFNDAFVKEFLLACALADEVTRDRGISQLHAHFAHTTTTVTMIASWLSGLPFSFTGHAKDIYARESNPPGLLKYKMQQASQVVTCTEANGRYLQEVFKREIHVIYHGLDSESFKRQSPYTPGEIPLVVSVGRLVEKKGFEYLIEACWKLKQQGRRLNCIILGGDDKHGEVIRRRIQDLEMQEEVKLVSAVTQEELKGYYEKASVFALACVVTDNGDRDGIPNVLVEAMSMEVPVVSTDVSAISELVENGRNGILVPSRDSEALSEGIAFLLDHPETAREFGRLGREKVRKDFDSASNTSSLSNLFKVGTNRLY